MIKSWGKQLRKPFKLITHFPEISVIFPTSCCLCSCVVHNVIPVWLCHIFLLGLACNHAISLCLYSGVIFFPLEPKKQKKKNRLISGYAWTRSLLTFDVVIHCARSICFVRNIFPCVSKVHYKAVKLQNKNECSSSWNPLGERAN